MEPRHRFLRACLRLPTDVPPVWIMRQAGRYLPAYRAVRSKTTFLGLCKTPELACEVTLQPINEFGMDAAILFSDILIPLEAMGMKLEFTEKGPSLPEPIKSGTQVDSLIVPNPYERVPFVMDAVKLIRRELADRVPLIGFAGAPFTMACYAIEGGGSSTYLEAKRFLFGDREAGHRLLDKISRTTTAYLAAQVEAGAQAVQLFDSWAGVLSPVDFHEFALPYVERIIRELRAHPAWQAGPVPIIYFPKGCSQHLTRIASCGADVIGLDWSLHIDDARAFLPNLAVQGNLDPAALLLPRAELVSRVKDVVARGRKAGPGHVFNLGHGVFPSADPEQLRALVDTVHEQG